MSESPLSATSPRPTKGDALPCSFAQFLVSLGSSAMVHLGETPDPSDGQQRKDLRLAGHTLNVLRVLQEKTRGNLDQDEQRLLDALVAEIGDKYAAITGQSSPPTCEG